MAHRLPLSLVLLISCSAPLLSSCWIEAAKVEPQLENGSMNSASSSNGTNAHLPDAFPVPVTSYGIYWWIYSLDQIKDYGETFRVLPYVLSTTLPLDPKRIWPGFPLKRIGDLKWNETLEKNPEYSPKIKMYLEDWYTSLVDAINGPDAQNMLDYFANDKYFTYIQYPSDVQSILREQARLAAKYSSWKQRSVKVPASQPSVPTLLPTMVNDETNMVHDMKTNQKAVINSTPVNNPLEAHSDSEDCTEDDLEEPAPSLVRMIIKDTIDGAREFEGRAVNFFYRMAMTSYLSNEEKAKDAIKCVLGLDCGVPSFVKGMLQEQGLPILLHGACTPGACSPETEEIARTFVNQLADTYPALFAATLNLVRDLGQQGKISGVDVTRLPS